MVPAPAVLQEEASDGTLFENKAFEAAADGSDGVAAELQAARLRLEAAESTTAALSVELTSTQARLHDALEVLEGVLGERTVLRRRAQELQAQLEAALADQRSSSDFGAQLPSPAGFSTEAGMQQQQQLRRELLLAQTQLAELRAAQVSWEAERQQLLQEVDEERQRLQEGLAEALTHATSAQRDADAAAERATHWCSLAQVLQRSALLTEGPSPISPASTVSRYSPASSTAKAASSAPASSSCSGGSRVTSAVERLLAEYCSPHGSKTQLHSQLRASPSGAGAASEAGAGLISAFHAVASVPGSAEKQLQGSPVLQRYGSPQQQHEATQGSAAEASPCSTNDGSSTPGLAASAELAPGTHLRLLNPLPTPGLSCASSPSLGGGPSPLTPQPCMAAAAAAATLDAERCTPAERASSALDSSCSPHPPASATPTSLRRSSSASGKAPKQGSLLSRLLMRGVCASGLPAGLERPAAQAGSCQWEQA